MKKRRTCTKMKKKMQKKGMNNQKNDSTYRACIEVQIRKISLLVSLGFECFSLFSFFP